jgi:hypothetical protein
MIEGKIFRERLRCHAGEEELFASLLYVNGFGPNCSHMTGAAGFPMKDLAGIERAREVELVHGCWCQPHEDLSHRLTRINTDWARTRIRPSLKICVSSVFIRG